ncbi:hypothetical protein [Luteococcus sp. OSA5]|uniref:hypothetical protein n=1 Tax=Luteococcus sp. OSA5 TaxID=3401630 RepID=UPI003B43BB5B
MLEVCLRLTSTLNQLAAHQTNPAQAEDRLRSGQVPHHVHDADALLGLDPLQAVPVRQALSRIAHAPTPRTGVAPWALLLPRPGRMAGLRGPLELNRAALAAGAVVMSHEGELAWLGQQVGAGVQWRLMRANTPLPVPDPRDAARQLGQVMTAAAQGLDALDLVAGQRPDQLHSPTLGEGYDARAQQLLDRAWLVLAATDQALAEQHEVLHSHGVLTRERHLRELADAALDAISAAASWPEWALQE